MCPNFGSHGKPSCAPQISVFFYFFIKKNIIRIFNMSPLFLITFCFFLPFFSSIWSFFFFSFYIYLFFVLCAHEMASCAPRFSVFERILKVLFKNFRLKFYNFSLYLFLSVNFCVFFYLFLSISDLFFVHLYPLLLAHMGWIHERQDLGF